jgi:hypothetical protein
MFHGLVKDSVALVVAKKAMSSMAIKGKSGGGSSSQAAMLGRIHYKLDKLYFYQPDFDIFLKEPEGEVGKHLHRLGKSMQIAAKRKVGVRTGHLRDSIYLEHKRMAQGQKMEIGSRVSYALMHHTGTRAHVIRPTKAKMLVFKSQGRLIVTPIVHHPGTKANKYLSDTLQLIYAEKF